MRKFIVLFAIILASYTWCHLLTLNLIMLQNMTEKEQYQLIKDIKQKFLKSRPHCTKTDVELVESDDNINEIEIYVNCIEWSS